MMMTTKIFLPHPVLVRRADGTIEPKFSLDRVREYGELVTCLGNSELALDAVSAREALLKRFDENDFDPVEDCFLIAGDATILCLMVEVALRYFGASPKYLRWNRDRRLYDVCGGGMVIEARGDE